MSEDGFVPYQHRVGYLLNRVPEAHMRRLHRRAQREQTSMTNIMGEILGERYGVEFVPSPRPQRLPYGPTGNLSLRLPLAVFEAVRSEADERKVTIRTVMLDALSVALRLKAPKPTSVDPERRPGRPPKERN